MAGGLCISGLSCFIGKLITGPRRTGCRSFRRGGLTGKLVTGRMTPATLAVKSRKSINAIRMFWSLQQTEIL